MVVTVPGIVYSPSGLTRQKYMISPFFESRAPLFREYVLLESSTVRLVSPVQPSNAPLPMEVTEPGMLISVSPLQYLNAPSPMVVTEFGMVSEASFPQFWNASLPMVVTDSGWSGRSVLCN